MSVHSCHINLLIRVTFYDVIKDAVKIYRSYRSFIKYFVSIINSRFRVDSGIFNRPYVNSSLGALTKMAKIGT